MPPYTQGDTDVVPAETERVVQSGGGAVGELPRLPLGDVEVDFVIEIVDVDGRRYEAARSASRVAIDSTAPVPPRRWPVIDLVPVMTTLRALSRLCACVRGQSRRPGQRHAQLAGGDEGDGRDRLQGAITLESMNHVDADIAGGLAVWRPVAERPDDVIDIGLPFLREQAKAAGITLG